MLAQRFAPFLKPVLILDAATCLAFAAGGLLFPETLSALFAIPVAWLVAGGAICLGFAGLLILQARQDRPSDRGMAMVVAGNVAWGAISLLAVLAGWLAPNALGQAFVIAQGIVVLVVADVQFLAWRGARVAGA